MSDTNVVCCWCNGQILHNKWKTHITKECPLRTSYEASPEKLSAFESSMTALPGCSATGPTDFSTLLLTQSPESQRKCPYCNLQSSTYSASKRHVSTDCPCKPVTVSPYKIVSDAQEDDTFGSVNSEEIDPSVCRALSFGDAGACDNNSSSETDEKNNVEPITQDYDDFGEVDSDENDFGDFDVNSSENTDSMFNWVYAICIYLLLFQFGNYISHGALSNLLWNFSEFLKLLVINKPELAAISALFPPSIYKLYKFVGLNKDQFDLYAVCSKCEATYRLDMVPQNLRCTCGNLVGRKIKNAIKPFHCYCVKSVQVALQELLLRDNFEESCDSWRKYVASTQTDVIFDVVDGRIWKEEMKHFVEKPNNYGFLLNLDWFQPYKRSQVSIGAIYLICLNLPRKLRFRAENVIVVGLLPWLEREPKCLDGFLRPIVEDFLSLWAGKNMCTVRSPGGVLVRGALFGTSSDMPATRKLNGFMACSGKKGCSKCTINLDS